MKKLSNEDIKISNFDIQQLIKKSFYDGTQINERFFDIEAIYRYYVSLLLYKKTDIVEYENDMLEHGLNQVPNKDKDAFQSTSGYKFFYIRNVFRIENLTIEEINELISFYKADKKVDEDVMNFIRATLFKTLYDPEVGEKELSYGLFHPNYFAKNGSLVLGFRYDSIENHYECDDLFEKYEEQEAYITMMLNGLNQELSDDVEYPITVIKFDENSVKKKSDKVM